MKHGSLNNLDRIEVVLGGYLQDTSDPGHGRRLCLRPWPFFFLFLLMLSGGCKLPSGNGPKPSAPGGVQGYWSDDSTPPRYWVFGSTGAVVDVPFDPSAGYYVVRVTEFDLKDKKLRIGLEKGGVPQEYTVDNLVQAQFALSKGGAQTNLRRLSGEEVKATFGAKYAADPEAWLTDIRNGRYRRE